MEYLTNNMFIHRDLAARNCLLDDTLMVKISDFGLTKQILDKTYYRTQTQFQLPLKWLAIESLEHSVYTLKTDLWSYGVLLWELMTRGQTPYVTVQPFELLHYLKCGKRLEQPPCCPDEVYAICLECWSPEPNERPEFSEIITRLEALCCVAQNETDHEYATIDHDNDGHHNNDHDNYI